MRIVLSFVLVALLCMSSVSAIAEEIPNMTEPQVVAEAAIPNTATEDADVNGRPQKLDTDDRTGEDLNPVERKIIRQDTIISNAPALAN